MMRRLGRAARMAPCPPPDRSRASMTIQRTISPVDQSVYVERPLADGAAIQAVLDRAHAAQVAWRQVPLDERRPQLVLQGPELPAQRRLRDPDRVRRASEAAHVCQRDEVRKLLECHGYSLRTSKLRVRCIGRVRHGRSG